MTAEERLRYLGARVVERVREEVAEVPPAPHAAVSDLRRILAPPARERVIKAGTEQRAA